MPIDINIIKPKITGRFPGRKLLNMEPINKEHANVKVHTKLIITMDLGGISILEVPYAILATNESMHKDDTSNNDTSINITSHFIYT